VSKLKGNGQHLIIFMLLSSANAPQRAYNVSSAQQKKDKDQKVYSFDLNAPTILLNSPIIELD